ncbi:MAG: monofunctional biosynthetic peptidoglycan transglycosylase [Rubrivivax sp.]|nr:monofunctional biosynthetic peptidoglycan transglycosylase [Rubrivivax sp.]
MKPVLSFLARAVALLLLSLIALQLFFVLRIAMMLVIDPQSTSFQRSEARRIIGEKNDLPWRQAWVPAARISDHLKRAVIASEDGSFAEHGGVDWDSLEKAWERNQKAEAAAERRQARAPASAPAVEAKVVGGSTITQQLAKNLLLSGERTVLRKAQEFVLTLALEGLLSKARILEIYLNSVEWGEGVFGAQAAAQHYFRTDADKLSAYQAARLAVMLPAPKRFEKRPGSAYLAARSATVMARMNSVALP